MNKTILTILLSVGISFILHSREPEKWIRYENPEYGFIIDFPMEPDTNPQTVDTELGELKMNLFQVDMSAKEDCNNLGYMVNFTLFPEFVADRSLIDLKGFYEGSIVGMKGNGELIDSSVCEISGHEGRQVKISIEDGTAFMYSKMVLAGSRFYIIMVITDVSKDGNEDILKYMNSFLII
jgi:hypothetical protein